MDSTGRLPRHFYSLDVLRGLAALIIVLWHWKHFFYEGTVLSGFDPARQPLYAWLRPFYDQGFRSNDLFFCLSGFIFFWLYGAKVGRGEVSFREFASLRFSRLYPLHLLTILLVIAGQAVFFARYRSFFVYEFNTPYFLALQLTFTSEWGLHPNFEFSFNGPSWSVSIEVLLYLIFFAFSRFGLNRPWVLALAAVAGLVLVKRSNVLLGQGVFSFFLGGLSFHLVERIQRRGLSRRGLAGLVGLTLLAWPLVGWALDADLPARLHRSAFPEGSPGTLASALSDRALSYVPFLGFSLILFPLSITTLALVECRRGSLGKRLAFLGHISYSAYLLHFPLQLAFVLVGPRFAPGSAFYDTPASLLIYFALLIPLSLACYRHFERPAQSFLRARLLPSLAARPGRGAAVAVAGPTNDAS